MFHKLEKSLYCTVLLRIVAHCIYLEEQSKYLETGIVQLNFPVSAKKEFLRIDRRLELVYLLNNSKKWSLKYSKHISKREKVVKKKN